MSSGTRLFVGNLPDNTNEKELLSAFSSYGEIKSLDLKSKSDDSSKKNFAFITLSSTNYDVETCIKHFSNHNFKGQKLYVTRARESFLERLQRERAEAQNTRDDKIEINERKAEIKLCGKLNPRKRKVSLTDSFYTKLEEATRKPEKLKPNKLDLPPTEGHEKTNNKKLDSDKKRLESLRKKRQEFKEKQMIIKTGLTGVDKVQNKKLIFYDDDEPPKQKNLNIDNKHNTEKGNKSSGRGHGKKSTLFGDNDDSGDELNFEIKKQFEGKKGQKVLDLQSRYKSDKRFILDERFVDDESEDEKEKQSIDEDETVELGQEDEKAKQMNILQNVLGVSIKSSVTEPGNNKRKSKIGMLRFDPSQPEHAKYLAPVEEQETTKKSKKKKKDKQEEAKLEVAPEIPKVEVSKEQFYRVSETLKEAIVQPTQFSLRSLFGNNEETKKDDTEQETGYIPLETSKDQNKKVRNPLDPGEKNPFVYDSSDSEGEEKEEEVKTAPLPVVAPVKAIWKENLFFSNSDNRLKEGLAFFNKTSEHEEVKERRELKSLMKKRIYNKERKNQMFQKKIGGRKKTMKKSYRKKS
ncbi:probable RNA-binding protein CG14230 [Pectinophora gossypiella]|uniref:RRM domain-containing protein n=1 Tax=Pectinophora gossypiella TaxID=13191 RepID=A0A1E1W5B3_PECGO|nr:probable RNA-binding protein CG14230 [Pectinophora gossypiella]